MFHLTIILKYVNIIYVECIVHQHSSHPQLGERYGRWFTLLKTLDVIKDQLEDCIGKKVILKANKGRKKITVKEGILEAVYPSLFVVRVSNEYESARRVSYTYSDVLTTTVEVTVCDDIEKEYKIS